MENLERKNDNLVIFQGESGAIELKLDESREMIWANRMQIAQVFGVNPQAISKHLGNIYRDNELEKKSTSSKMELVQDESGREIKRKVDFYNLDAIISIGYRINSKNATSFRKWATKTLKEHITNGYTINENLLKEKKDLYLNVLEDIKKLSNENNSISNNEIIDLIKAFSSTWFNLESYDKQNLPTQGSYQSEKDVDFKNLAKELYEKIAILKKDLMEKKEATSLFAQEKVEKSLEGILGNVLQSVFGQDLYKTTEERASYLLYFIIKNHPFNDGNKRSGAFSFIWFLQKMGFSFMEQITPSALTAITLLIAESDPKDKDKMIGLVLLLLRK